MSDLFSSKEEEEALTCVAYKIAGNPASRSDDDKVQPCSSDDTRSFPENSNKIITSIRRKH